MTPIEIAFIISFSLCFGSFANVCIYRLPVDKSMLTPSECMHCQKPIPFYFNIPLFGWYLRKIGSIAIVRETTTKENLNFFDKVKKEVEKNKRPLLIFPQGTRVKLEDQPPFKKGVGRIYKALNLPCIPVALNTGKVWPKNSFMKYPGDIHISFLEPIMSGKDNDEFTKDIENQIYTEIKKFY